VLILVAFWFLCSDSTLCSVSRFQGVVNLVGLLLPGHLHTVGDYFSHVVPENGDPLMVSCCLVVVVGFVDGKGVGTMSLLADSG
jgi:hypothetical protein